MADEEAGAKKAAGGKKKIIMGVAGVALAGGGYFFMGSSSAAEGDKKVEHVPGEVIVADPMHINLADGHFLKIQIALQVIEGPAHAPSEAPALDAAVDLFSGQDMEYVASPKGRKKLKQKLVEKVDKLYHHEVYDVYFTQYVVQ